METRNLASAGESGSSLPSGAEELLTLNQQLRRILDDIKKGAYELTAELLAEVEKFRRHYDRHAKFRMDLVEVDCKQIDAKDLVPHGIDFISLDEEGTQLIWPVLMNGIDRVSTACVGARVFEARPNYFDTLSFFLDMFLGRTAPELGRIGIAKEARVDNGDENARTILKPVLRPVGCELSYARSETPEDKPYIERFQRTLQVN